MVIDASVVFKWFAEEEGSDRAIALIGQQPLDAPEFLVVEVGNAIWKRHKRGEILVDDAPQQLAGLGQICSLVTDARLAPRALEIALQLQHPIYDCLYLALAEELNSHVVTADMKFFARTRSSPFEAIVRQF